MNLRPRSKSVEYKETQTRKIRTKRSHSTTNKTGLVEPKIEIKQEFLVELENLAEEGNIVEKEQREAEEEDLDTVEEEIEEELEEEEVEESSDEEISNLSNLFDLPVPIFKKKMATFTPAQLVEIIPKCNDEKGVEHFITTIDPIVPLIDAADLPLFLVLIKAKISGKAFNAIKGKTVDTWPQIKNLLTTELEDKIDMATAINKLNKLRQFPNESLKDYIDRIKEALAILNKITIREVSANIRDQMVEIHNKTAKQAFEAGLASFPLKTVVIAAQKATFSDSYRFAVNQEQSNFPSKKNNNSDNNYSNNKQSLNKNMSEKKPIVCYNCNKTGHISPNCPLPKKEKNNSQSNTGSGPSTSNGNSQRNYYNRNNSKNFGSNSNGKNWKKENEKQIRVANTDETEHWDNISPCPVEAEVEIRNSGN